MHFRYTNTINVYKEKVHLIYVTSSSSYRSSITFGLIHSSTPISDNYIDGQEFLFLSENNIKTMVPPIGLARKIF